MPSREALSVGNGVDRTIRLRDGRRLGYAEWGGLGGPPVLYFHGWPGSRLEGRLADEAARGEGVRLIALDRPGMGLSDYQPRRRLVDWPDDVLQLATALGLERFAVLGISGGGPYAAVCAWKLPEQLTRAEIVSSLAPLDGFAQDGHSLIAGDGSGRTRTGARGRAT